MLICKDLLIFPLIRKKTILENVAELKIVSDARNIALVNIRCFWLKQNKVLHHDSSAEINQI